MIDPKKLEAFGGGSKGRPAASGRGAPPPPEEEHAEPDGEAGEDVGGVQKYVPLLELLEEFQDDVEQCVDELDGDVLIDPEGELSPEDLQIMKEGWALLDQRLRKEMLKSLAGAPSEDCALIADHLYNEDKTDDPERLEGWLYRLGDWLTTPEAKSFRAPAPADDGEGDEVDDGGEYADDEYA